MTTIERAVRSPATSAPAAIASRFVTGDGTALRVVDTGPPDGEVTVVMAHGWTLDHTLWDRVVGLGNAAADRMARRDPRTPAPRPRLIRPGMRLGLFGAAARAADLDGAEHMLPLERDVQVAERLAVLGARAGE